MVSFEAVSSWRARSTRKHCSFCRQLKRTETSQNDLGPIYTERQWYVHDVTSPIAPINYLQKCNCLQFLNTPKIGSNPKLIWSISIVAALSLMFSVNGTLHLPLFPDDKLLSLIQNDSFSLLFSKGNISVVNPTLNAVKGEKYPKWFCF